MERKSYHVKKGDAVHVLSGAWKGYNAKIIAVLNKKDRVVLEFVDLNDKKRAALKENIGKKTVKKTPDNPTGGLIERSVSVHVSNVALLKAK